MQGCEGGLVPNLCSTHLFLASNAIHCTPHLNFTWTPILNPESALLQHSGHLCISAQGWDKIEEVQRAKASPTPPLNMVCVAPKLFGRVTIYFLDSIFCVRIRPPLDQFMWKRTGFHTMCWPSCATWACISKQWLLPPYPHHPALPYPAAPLCPHSIRTELHPSRGMKMVRETK